jgi:hypothetical protein
VNEFLKRAWAWLKKPAAMLAIALIMVALAQTLPADMALWMAGEVVAYLDALVGVWVAPAFVATSGVAPAIWRWARGALRRRRAPRTRKLRAPASDEEDAPAAALAFA